jgi:putative Holliday junction resolvase
MDEILIGIDFGTKRIGVALSSTNLLPASPITTIHRSKRLGHDIGELIRIAGNHKATAFVLGLPLLKDGSSGRMANLASEFCRALEKVSPIPVHTVDESFSSAYADDDLFSRGFTAERVTKLRDAMAACHIIEAWRKATESQKSAE